MSVINTLPVLILDSQDDGYVVANAGLSELGGGVVEDVTLSGATTDLSTLVPQHARIEAVTVRVMEAITGSGVTGFDVGDTGDGAGLSASATRYASNVGLSAGSIGGGFVTAVTVAYGGTVTLRLAAIGGTFSGGRVRVRAAWTPRTIPAP